MNDEVSLAFLARRSDRVLDRLGALEDHIAALTGIAMRHDGVELSRALERRE